MRSGTEYGGIEADQKCRSVMKTSSSAMQSVDAGLAKKMLGAGMDVGISAGIREYRWSLILIFLV
jgi:hypothetical protein